MAGYTTTGKEYDTVGGTTMSEQQDNGAGDGLVILRGVTSKSDAT